MCSPWATQDFIEAMEKASTLNCKSCLPDCSVTSYKTQLSLAPFDPCDHTNIGSSPMCQISLDQDINPPQWSNDVFNEYLSMNITVPDFVKKYGILSNLRESVQSGKDKYLLMKGPFKRKPFYDAFERDIAMVEYYFDSTTLKQFRRQPSMTMLDFVGKIGGLLGLLIGVSLVSIIELMYWILVFLNRVLMESNK